MSAPLISVITPVYNMRAFIAETIESVQAQTCGDFELLLVDDCSTDETLAIMQRFAEHDRRIRLLSTSVNSWAHAAGNVALDHARGRYVAILDADDRLPANRFERQLTALEADPEIDVCGGWMKLFCDSERTIASFETDDLAIRMGLLFDSTMAHGTAMIRRSVIEDHGIRYDTGVYYAHDYHFFTQLAFDAKARFTSIPHVVYHYRWHAQQASNAKRGEQIGYSDKVRQGVLARFGVDEPTLVAIHLHFCHKQAWRLEVPDAEIARYYEALVEGNRRAGYFPDAAFRHYLASKICADMRRCGPRAIRFYLGFPHRRDVEWSPSETLRFFVKSLRRPKKVTDAAEPGGVVIG